MSRVEIISQYRCQAECLLLLFPRRGNLVSESLTLCWGMRRSLKQLHVASQLTLAHQFSWRTSSLGPWKTSRAMDYKPSTTQSSSLLPPDASSPDSQPMSSNPCESPWTGSEGSTPLVGYTLHNQPETELSYHSIIGEHSGSPGDAHWSPRPRGPADFTWESSLRRKGGACVAPSLSSLQLRAKQVRCQSLRIEIKVHYHILKDVVFVSK